MKYLTVFLIACLHISPIFGQQILPAYSQYITNHLLVNPAVAGTNGSKIKLGWRGIFGFENAPQNIYISGGIELGRSGGLGFIITNDQGSVLQYTSAQVGYAYNFQIAGTKDNPTRFALGLQAQVFRNTLNINKINAALEDPLLQNINDEPNYNGSVGFWLYNPKFYAGFSWLNIGAKNKIAPNANYPLSHIFLTYGYKFSAGQEDNVINFIPSVLGRIVYSGYQNQNIQTFRQLDINLLFDYNNIVWIDFSYRTSRQLSVTTGINFSKIDIAYTYNYIDNSIAFNGIHEIVLGLHWLNAKNRRKKLSCNFYR